MALEVACFINGAIFTLINLCTCLYSWFYRSKQRREYGLKANRSHDCLVPAFCLPCALCQEYQELQNSGFNMEMGWEGNARQRKEVAMVPKVEGGMKR
ncbi:hypothetical protein NL676_037965 [Syzygium grande]|nr:hypothetical protein NL676_037965 [Syzygium grande]